MSSTGRFANGVSKLSPGKRTLLEQLMKGRQPDRSRESCIPRRRKLSPVPLSFSQQRLWIIHQLVPDNPFYNMPSAFKINGELQVAKFEQSLNEVIRRHETLRTIFVTEDEQPVQVILPELKLKLDFFDLSTLSRRNQEEKIKDLALEEASQIFDLEQGPLLRGRLLHINPKEHVFLFTMHHIISDTWSMELLIKETAVLYQAFLSDKPSPLPGLPIQYGDFAIWQRQRLRGPLLENELSYWKKQLGGNLPFLELPADRQRPAVQTYQGGFLSFEIPGILYEKLVELSRQEECTRFMVMLSAFYLLLYRYTSQEDILVGSPIANRTQPELEGLIGFFANTLVFRTHLAGNCTFRQLVQQVRTVTTAAYTHQELPFEKLVEELQPERYMSHTPLFQVMFVMQNVPKQSVNAPSTGLTLTSMPYPHNRTSKFDLWLSITQRETGINGMVEYNSDIFDQSTICRLLEHFKILLEEITRTPNRSINELPIIPAEEKHQILEEWNDTARDYHLRCLHHIFTDQVKQQPSQVVLVGPKSQTNMKGLLENCSQVHLTYRELNEKSNQLAQILREKGVKPDVIVGIMMERSIEMIIGLMGVLKAGGAYLPIDPDYPEERIAYMLADSNANVLVTSSTLAKEGEKLRSLEVKRFHETIFIDTLDFSSLSSSHLLNFSTSPSSLAYLIYTSGSTGKPKGVVISHEGICNRLLWMQETYQLTRDDRVLQKTPFGFDVSVWEFFWAPLNSAVLVIARPGGHKDAAYLAELINREHITFIHFVPSMLVVFLEEPVIEKNRGLRHVISSGEVLPVEYQQRFFDRLNRFNPQARLHNLYGPTEASVDVTYWPCRPLDNHRSIPIGRPVANTQIYILDQNANLVPIGVPGEIHISGIQLARGYLNRPELTCEKFKRAVISHSSFVISSFKFSPNDRYSRLSTNDQCPMTNDRSSQYPITPSPHHPNRSSHHPITPLPQSPIYQTGDLGRWQPDGNIEFLGRIDQQVKIRGFRIELGEIESYLRHHPSLQEAAVDVREDRYDSNEKKLTAYVVPCQDYWISRQHSGKNLAEQQVKEWQWVFNDTYGKSTGKQDPIFNTAGWNSSYTGKPIPVEEMQEWVDFTVKRILSLQPQLVLEIGCGTGLLLFGLIPHCRHYTGTDISSTGLDSIRAELERKDWKKPGTAEVFLEQRAAHDLHGIEPQDFDTAIINSVVQYFPSVDYLLEVLKHTVKTIKPGGNIFIGDIRSLPLLELFYTSVGFYQAQPGTTLAQLSHRIKESISREQELVIDPMFFIALKQRIPEITGVELLHKHSRFHNELTRFRYDVILHISDGTLSGSDDLSPLPMHSWQKEGLTLAGVCRRLETDKPLGMRIVDVPNARISRYLQVMNLLKTMNPGDTVEEMEDKLARLKENAVDPQEFLQLTNRLPYCIEIHLSPFVATSFQVVFKHKHEHHRKYKLRDLSKSRENPGTGIHFQAVKDTAAEVVESHPWHFYTNNPLLVKATGELVPELRSYLKDRLPEYMVPSNFLLLDTLPLTPNGKLDRRSLPAPIQLLPEQENDFIEPRTPMEKFFHNIWWEVLNYDKISITSNFFQLGGDSINAIRVISRANKEGLNLSVRDLYQNQDIASLARTAEKKKKEASKEPGKRKSQLAAPIKIPGEAVKQSLPAGMEIEDIFPATPFQQHIVHYLKTHEITDPPIFLFLRNYPPLHITMEIEILRQAYLKVVEHQPMLRTILAWKNLEEPVQVVCRQIEDEFMYYDLSSLSPTLRNEKYEELMKEEWERGFGDRNTIPVRVVMVKWDPEHSRFFYTCDYSRMAGWSSFNIFQYIFDYYFALASGKNPEFQPNNYYNQYLFRLKNQDLFAAKKYWQLVFKGINQPKAFVNRFPGSKPGDRKGIGRRHLYLSAETTLQLELFLQKHRLVLSTVAKGIWALLLGGYVNENDIIFGLLTTGRSIASAGIEAMTGHAINILPVRVKIIPEQAAITWLRQIWHDHMEWNQYEYTQVDKIKQWCGISGENPLFDSFMVIQNIERNILRESDNQKNSPGLPRSSEYYLAKMEYPLRWDIFLGPEICLVINYYCSRIQESLVNRILEDLQTLLRALTANPYQTVGELMENIPTGK